MPSSSSGNAAIPAVPGSFIELRKRLVWLTLFRLVATTLLLVVQAVRLLPGPSELELTREDSLTFLVIGVMYSLALIYGVIIRWGRVGPRLAYAQALGDVATATILVYLTGGLVDSPFPFTYLLAVMAAAILLPQRGALIAAAASSGACASLVLLVQTRVVPSPLGAEPPSLGRAIPSLLVNILAQFLIAVLASYLSRQLSAAGGTLSAREAELKKLGSLQEQILACMPSGLITCKADGRITFINPAARAILGLSAETGAPWELEALLPGGRRLGPSVRRTELAVETKVGRKILGLTVTPLEGSEGSLLIVFQDLTELRRMEEELKRVDQLAALGKLAAQLAHEIRNPLAAMRGSAQMLAQEAHEDAAAARLTGILVREADRLSGLVEDFLRFARPPPPALRPFSLKVLTADTVEMLRADPLAQGIRIGLELQELAAQMDPDQIRQVLINLLRNAFAAVSPGGEVRVVVEEREGRPRIRVWDSAGSIPRADLLRIFEPFFTTRQGGTGLGLSTAHSIIRAHGGAIQVTSSPEAGTEFVVGFPPMSSEVAGADTGGG